VRRLFTFNDRLTTRWFPELRFCETATERAALWRLCYLRWLRRRGWRHLLLLCVLSVAVQIAMSAAVAGLQALGVRGFNAMMFMAAAGMGGALVGLGWIMIISRSMQRELRVELRARGVPVCLACGYDLRGQIEPRCPECGTASAG